VHDRLLTSLVLLFFASEVTLASVRRSRRKDGATRADRGSVTVLWIVITAAITAAVSLAGDRPGRLPFPPSAIRGLASALLVSGAALRWWAVVALGRFFTVDVATHADHALVDTGPFRFVRHPSYTGLLLEFCGFGVALGNGLSLIVLLVPILVALAYRMHVEEAALRRVLGAPYTAYCAKTKRIIPGLI
jgi:protein-S-isoprenylcysteine O-methyltransferase